MTSGVSLAITTPFANHVLGKGAHDRNDLGVGVGGRDQLQEFQIARRVEEVGTEQARLEGIKRPSASACSGTPEVFEEIIAAG